MSERWQIEPTPRDQNAKVRVGGLAARQFGRVSWRQLVDRGIGTTTIGRWVEEGYLQRVLPGVYAVGHAAPSYEGKLAAALLYAGSGSMLSHATALSWLGLTDRKYRRIEVSTPARHRGIRGIRVHCRRTVERTWHKGLPVTSVTQTLVDFAAEAPLNRIRHALADAEFKGVLNLEEIESMLGRGRKGSANLRRALERHQPQIARTRSELERRFLYLCETYGIPVPEFNVRVEGELVDAFWRDQRLVVEIDGDPSHATKARIENDRRRELKLRLAGYPVFRYTDDQLRLTPELIAADVKGERARAA